MDGSSGTLTAQAVLTNVSQTVSCDTIGSIPCMKRNIQRTQQRNEAVPPMYKTLVDLHSSTRRV